MGQCGIGAGQNLDLLGVGISWCSRLASEVQLVRRGLTPESCSAYSYRRTPFRFLSSLHQHNRIVDCAAIDSNTSELYQKVGCRIEHNALEVDTRIGSTVWSHDYRELSTNRRSGQSLLLATHLATRIHENEFTCQQGTPCI